MEIIQKYVFNTSNVTIQLSAMLILQNTVDNFNTSNVTIQQVGIDIEPGEYKHFNTSNVTIQLITRY